MSFASLRPLALAAAATLACGSAWSQSPITITVSSWVPPAHTLTETQKEWCTMLEQKTSGKVKCNILPRAVSAPPGTFDAVRNGLADLSFTVHGYTPGRFVTTQMVEVPFLGDSSEVTSVAFQRMYAKNPAIADEHKGVKVLAVFTHGPGIVFNTKKPVAKMDDLTGMKWRIGGGMVNEISQGAGHERHAQAGARKLRAAVHRRDGRHPVPGRVGGGFKIDKVIKYATLFPGGLYNTSFVFMMNQAKYDSDAGRREEGRSTRCRASSPRA
jgi:TRAP-type mannitol/chloroaromatic compound transport system substrate-binding protein